MKNRARNMYGALALLALSAFSPQLSTGFAQGSLAPPPGAPAPTMITLNQIEPRTPISSAPCTITNPGSYYLTTNLNVTEGDAIDIDTNGVTLDLNGFTISSTSTSFGTAILLTGDGSSITDITIANGHITGGVTYDGSGTYSSGPGFVNGIVYNSYGGLPCNVRVNGVSVSGCAGDAINLGTTNSTLVESCTVNTVGGSGIIASSISHSTANLCGSVAITADIVSDCYAYSTGADGIDVGDNGIVKDCTTGNNGADGIDVGNNCNIEDCTVTGSKDYFGINTGNNCALKDCTVNGNYDGIVTGTACAVNDCTTIGNGYVGIAPGDYSAVIDCTACANGGAGIGIVDFTTVKGCTASGNTEDGIDAYGSYCRIDGNTCSGNGESGLSVEQDNAGNSVIRNAAPGNVTDYLVPSGDNDIAPVQIPGTATSPWANF